MTKDLRERLDTVERALDAAWQDIQDWLRLAREQRAAHPNPSYAVNMPSEAGIDKSIGVLFLLAGASKAIAALEPSIAHVCSCGDSNKLREEIERWRSINRELRQKLALAGVEGSPPGVPTLMDRLKRAEQERDSARAEVQTLRESLRVIHTTVRGDEKSECRTIRKWLDKRGVFNGDLGSSKRLIEAACLAAISPKEPR